MASATYSLVGIVPTQNRPNDVARLFESINKLAVPGDVSFRVVLVDNSADGSMRVAFDRLACTFPAQYVHEPRPGLSRARNAAAPHIRPSDIICTIDDDIILPEDYLGCVKNALMQHPDAGVIGGRVELYDSRDLPMTIKTETSREYYDWPIEPAGFIHGCCMIIPAAIVAQHGWFDERLGAGTPVSGGEDSDLYFRIWRSGKRVVYEPSIYVYHNHGRRDAGQIDRLLKGYWRGEGAMYMKQLLRGDMLPLRYFYWGLTLMLASDAYLERYRPGYKELCKAFPRSRYYNGNQRIFNRGRMAHRLHGAWMLLRSPRPVSRTPGKGAAA